ncbi:MAG: hypothetical protein H7A51_10920 [Akkermansiaceae bacterium]|nr:hypothetical protein [Akkermansiaceae bacterium]
MKPTIFRLSDTLASPLIWAVASLAIGPMPAVGEILKPEADGKDIKVDAVEKAEDEKKPAQPAKPKSRLYLTNGDKLSGLPQSINAEQHLLFDSDSLKQTASFPIANVLSINLDSWKEQPKAKTVARIKLQTRFRESTGDTILGELKELTPDSIKLDTWYGGVISLKRSMVQSLKIISNTPGNYYGPNSMLEWSVAGEDDSWSFQNGSLVSASAGTIGRDIGLREKSHISFDAVWKSTMRFKFQVYSSDVKSTNPDAYYEVSINRSYAYMRTRGKSVGGARLLGGGRWKQIAGPPDENQAHFDVFVNRKTGAITIYINGLQACMLQSENPDPENLGTGLSFVAEDRYPLEISGITVTPWNGTTFPKDPVKPQAKAADGEDAKDPKADKDDKADEAASEAKEPPHKIILNNGDEVPGTIGKVDAEGRMIIETEFTPIRIPIDRIKSLSLGDQGEEPKKYSEDVRAWFHTGGFVTLKLDTFKEGRISGYSQALGDVTFDLSAFSRIDFHIYDHEANETRKKIR